MTLRAPAEVRRRTDGRRVLAWAPSGTSSLVATEELLVLPEGFDPSALGWDRILRVSWGTDVVEITAQPTPGAAPVVLRVHVVLGTGVLPAVVRERVNASIVVQHHVPLVGELGARVVARRTSGSDELRWSVVFDAGLDPADPGLRDQADSALAELRTSLGI